MCVCVCECVCKGGLLSPPPFDSVIEMKVIQPVFISHNAERLRVGLGVKVVMVEHRRALSFMEFLSFTHTHTHTHVREETQWRGRRSIRAVFKRRCDGVYE